MTVTGLPAWVRRLFKISPEARRFARRAKLAALYRRDDPSRLKRPSMTAARVKAWRKARAA